MPLLQPRKLYLSVYQTFRSYNAATILVPPELLETLPLQYINER